MNRQRLLSGARVAIAVVVLAAVVYAVVKNWADVSVHLGQISGGTFALSTLAAAVGTGLTMLGWRVVLADLGSELHLAPASGVYFVGQLGKYLPGSLWSVLVQADMAALGLRRAIDYRMTDYGSHLNAVMQVINGRTAAAMMGSHPYKLLPPGIREQLRIASMSDDETWTRARAWAFVGPGMLTIANYRHTMPSRVDRLTSMVETIAAEVDIELR